jgi:hypothetical protein
MAAAAQSKGGAVLFTAATDTFSPNSTDEAPILIRGISITGGSAAGSMVLKEGSDSSGVADASGAVVWQGYMAVGMTQFVFFDEPFVCNGGLKPSAMTAASIIVVYLA